jgi:predicted HAD superfamily Cof-like phosphohydrolase
MNPYHQTPVLEFHEAFGALVSWTPTLPGKEIRLLRLNLLLEELLELAEASGFKMEVSSPHNNPAPAFVSAGDTTYEADLPRIVAAADALADLKYVVEGTALVWGIPLEACFLEVHRSNMSKLKPDGHPLLRADGKVLKGPNYRAPDLKQIILRAQAEKQP